MDETVVERRVYTVFTRYTGGVLCVLCPSHLGVPPGAGRESENPKLLPLLTGAGTAIRDEDLFRRLFREAPRPEGCVLAWEGEAFRVRFVDAWG